MTFNSALWSIPGLENCTRPLVFTSASGYRASENFDILSENYFSPIYANIYGDAGQVPILRYFEACIPLFRYSLGPDKLASDQEPHIVIHKINQN